MLKVQVTKKQIVDNYKNVISVGYCDLQYLLRFKDARFYTAGVYGWNADIYEINYNTAIVTGYRPFGNIKVDYGILKGFESRASHILNLSGLLTYDEQKKAINDLLNEFIQVVLKMND